MLGFKITEGQSGSHSQIKFQGPYFLSNIYPHTNTAELQNIVTEKTRYAHLRHLRPCVGQIVLNPMNIKIFTKNLIKNNETIESPEKNQDFFSLRRSERIKSSSAIEN